MFQFGSKDLRYFLILNLALVAWPGTCPDSRFTLFHIKQICNAMGTLAESSENLLNSNLNLNYYSHSGFFMKHPAFLKNSHDLITVLFAQNLDEDLSKFYGHTFRKYEISFEDAERLKRLVLRVEENPSSKIHKSYFLKSSSPIRTTRRRATWTRR